MARNVTVGLLGCGYVGGGVCGLLERVREDLARREGIRLSIRRVLIRDVAKERQVNGAPVPLPADRFTVEPEAILADPRIDVVAEAMGGAEPAASYIRRALAAGKGVATANKAVVAEEGPALAVEAARRGAAFSTEAAVCGAVPILSTLSDALAGDRVTALEGIVNATCNYILGRMEEGLSYAEALADARRTGYTEADPALDVDGIDAAQKLAILVWRAFGAWIPWREIPRAGVRDLAREEVARAAARGRVLRLVARAARKGDSVRASVGLLELNRGDPLADVSGEHNGVRLRCTGAGTLFLSGPGAGAFPTASALLGDVVRIARSLGRESGRRAAFVA